MNTIQMFAAMLGIAAPPSRPPQPRSAAPKSISRDERERRKHKKRLAEKSRKRNR